MSSKHDALKADFAHLIDDWRHSTYDEDATNLVNRLVHMVVLHGLLPEDGMVEVGDPLFNEDGTPWRPDPEPDPGPGRKFNSLEEFFEWLQAADVSTMEIEDDEVTLTEVVETIRHDRDTR